MKRFFITGTDTGVGKTYVAATLVMTLQAHYWKPIQSGLATDFSDLETVKKLTGLAETHFFPSAYGLQAPLSPDQAARLEQQEIDLEKCTLPSAAHLIVEGAGGVCVPLNSSASMLDLMKKLALPVIIVARGTLGTINHTLLTINMLRQWKLSIAGVVFNGDLNPENQFAIEQWGNIQTLFHLPTVENLSSWVKDNKQKIEAKL